MFMAVHLVISLIFIFSINIMQIDKHIYKARIKHFYLTN